MQHIGRMLLIQHGMCKLFLQCSDENFELEDHSFSWVCQFQLDLPSITKLLVCESRGSCYSASQS